MCDQIYGLLSNKRTYICISLICNAEFDKNKVASMYLKKNFKFDTKIYRVLHLEYRFMSNLENRLMKKNRISY